MFSAGQYIDQQKKVLSNKSIGKDFILKFKLD